MVDKKVGIIIQARMGSSRLPGKVLMNLDDDNKVLELLIKRLKLSKLTDEIIIATSSKRKNSLIIDLAKLYNVFYFVGSEENVLKRYYQAAKKFYLNTVIRITSDCPFLDPYVLDQMVNLFLNSNYDFITNLGESTNFPLGFSIEIFSFKTLEKVYLNARSKPEKEHVTYYILTRQSEFNIFYYNLEKLKKIDNLRLTIDEKEDLIMCREVYNKLKKIGKPINFSIYDVIDIIEKNPELININKHIQQKKAKNEDLK